MKNTEQMIDAIEHLVHLYMGEYIIELLYSIITVRIVSDWRAGTEDERGLVFDHLVTTRFAVLDQLLEQHDNHVCVG